MARSGLSAAILCLACAAVLGAETAAPQFGGQCTEGLAQGRHVMTDCTITWTGKDGKVYCFSSEDARKAFLTQPDAELLRAQDFIAASSVESTEKAMQYFSGGDAESLVSGWITAQAKANKGVFPYDDPLNGDHLALIYDGIDFTRTIDGYGFFPDVKFHDQQIPEKHYLIDFWVQPIQGQLQIQETRIYKEPVQAEGHWTITARQPIPWWWIPASEHPGHVAVKRSWEVMSAVEQAALQESLKHGGVYLLKDDRTGQELHLEFIDAHQPIRQLAGDGHFFACTDFRVAGTKDQIYDIDFWINDKDGTLSVDRARVHKVPQLKDGQWVQVPRYDWKDLGDSHVVP